MINPNSKQFRSTIAWVASGVEPSARLCAEMEKAGFQLQAARPATNGEAAARRISRYPDLALIDLRDIHRNERMIATLAKKARTLAPTGGIVFIASPDTSPAIRKRLRKSGDLCLTQRNYTLLADICRERLRLSKLAEVAGERLKSLAEISRLSTFPPFLMNAAAPSVLVAGAPTPAALAAINAASKVASCVTSTLSVGQTMRALDHGNFDLAVFLPEDENDVLFSLARAMRRHREHRRLPIINILGNREILERIDTRAGAEVMLAEHIGEDLSGQIETLTRRARLMAAMRSFLSAPEGDGVIDRVSRTFNAQFFAKHAARMFVRADETGRPLSLVGVTIKADSADGAAQTKTMAQAANIMRRVIRAEDAVARVSPTTFVLMAAATASNDALRIAKRTEGIIANTTYRAGGGAAIFRTAVLTGAVGRKSGEKIEETTARLLASLQVSQRIANAQP